jgi:DNA-binding NarL/FixJ family response regulator
MVLMFPNAKVIGVVSDPTPRILELSLAAKVDYLLHRDSGYRALSDAVRSAMTGKRFYDPALSDSFKDSSGGISGESERRIGGAVVDLGAEEIRATKDAFNLTDRENQVLKLLTRGMTNRQIATRLDVTERTVTFHTTNLYRKMGVSSRLEAALMAMLAIRG